MSLRELPDFLKRGDADLGTGRPATPACKSAAASPKRGP